MNRKGFAPIVIVLTVAAALVLGGGVLYYVAVTRHLPLYPVMPAPAENQLNTPTSLVVVSTTTTQVDTSTWQTYRNEKFDFDIQYPFGWTARESVKGGEDLYAPGGDLASIFIRYYKSLNDLPLNPVSHEYYDDFSQYVMDPHFFKNQKNIYLGTVAAWPAVPVTDPEQKTRVILVNGNFLYGGKYYYEISYQERYGWTFPQLEQIIQTFTPDPTLPSNSAD